MHEKKSFRELWCNKQLHVVGGDTSTLPLFSEIWMHLLASKDDLGHVASYRFDLVADGGEPFETLRFLVFDSLFIVFSSVVNRC